MYLIYLVTYLYLHPNPWAHWLLLKTIKGSYPDLEYAKISLLETHLFFSLCLLILFPLGPHFPSWLSTTPLIFVLAF